MSKDNAALGENGARVEMTPDEVKANVIRVLKEDGTVLAIIKQAPNGQIAVAVAGPPSWAVADALAKALRGLIVSLTKSAGRGH